MSTFAYSGPYKLRQHIHHTRELHSITANRPCENSARTRD